MPLPSLRGGFATVFNIIVAVLCCAVFLWIFAWMLYWASRWFTFVPWPN